jgi:hypothetical protein
MANPFEVAPVNLSGLGMIANAYGQKSQQDQMKEDQMMQMEQQKAGASNAMKLLNQANMAQDPAERERLFMEAYQASPDFTNGLISNMKRRAEVQNLTQDKAESSEKVGAQEILEDGTVIQSTQTGTKVYSPTGDLLKGQAAADAVKSARAEKVSNLRKAAGQKKMATLEAQNELQGEVEAGLISKKEAAKASIAAFDKIENINDKISLYDEGIQLIDSGAGSGQIEKLLPSFKSASIKLDNLANRLGLDVVGNTTFGALSAGELAMAMSTALPTGLDGPQLREWLVEKKESQEKLADYLESAAIYLGTPGNTKVGWIKKKKMEREKGSNNSEDKGKANSYTSQSGIKFTVE